MFWTIVIAVVLGGIILTILNTPIVSGTWTPKSRKEKKEKQQKELQMQELIAAHENGKMDEYFDKYGKETT